MTHADALALIAAVRGVQLALNLLGMLLCVIYAAWRLSTPSK